MAIDNRLPDGVTNPFSDAFLETWKLWKDYKWEEHKFKYKGCISEQVALMQLVKKADGSEEIARKIIVRSIEHCWAGLYPFATKKIKENGRKKSNDPAHTREQLNDLYNERFGEEG